MLSLVVGFAVVAGGPHLLKDLGPDVFTGLDPGMQMHLFLQKVLRASRCFCKVAFCKTISGNEGPISEVPRGRGATAGSSGR